MLVVVAWICMWMIAEQRFGERAWEVGEGLVSVHGRWEEVWFG
jgi:hypothetical protein